MRRNRFALRALGLALVMVLALSLRAAAQGRWVGTGPTVGEAAPPAEAGEPLLGLRQAQAQDVPLGEAGLSFRWVQTLGETRVPYLADNTRLNFPFGVWAGGGNVWIADSFGRRALKFGSGGTYAAAIGTPGVALYQDHTLDWIGDVAVDAGGNVWLADTWACHVLQFNASGAFVRELGEAGVWADDNQHFGRPVSVAFDSAGNVYVSDGLHWWDVDSGNHRIQIFDSAGNYLNTIGQTGVAGQGNNQFRGPAHIAIYANTLYVADAGNHRVQIFNVANPAAPTYVATIGVTGVPGNDNSHLGVPMGVAVTSSSIYVADSGNHRVQVFDRTTRAYQRTIGTGQGAGNTQFESPVDVAVDGSYVYVADPLNYRVQQFTTAGAYQRTYGVTGVPYLTDGQHYNTPSGVAVADDGSVYVVEEKGQRLLKLNANGSLAWSVGAAGVKGDWEWSNYRLNDAGDVAIDRSGRVFVADQNHGRVQIYDAAGTYVGTLNQWSGGSDYLGCPRGLGFGPNGWLYVADLCRNRVAIFDASLAYVASLGVADQPGGDNAHFNMPSDVAVASDGTIYVVDPGNARVQVFNAARAYLRTIGVTGEFGDALDHFGWPESVWVDGANRVYVSDPGNSRVVVLNSTGGLLARVGAGWGTSEDEMWNPRGLAADGDGRLYVADAENHRVLVFAAGYPGWVQANVDGFGGTVSFISTLAPFKSYLYAGSWEGPVWRTSDGRTWTRVNPTWTFGASDAVVFGTYLYMAGGNQAEVGEIWRTDSWSWQQVVTNGFGDARNMGVSALCVFNNMLYAATNNPTTGTEVWRSATGAAGSWSQVNQDGFGSGGTWQDQVMDVYGGRLYLGLSRNGVGELWRTANGTTWQAVFTDSLGSPNNSSVSALAEFNGNLYVALRNTVSGAEVWRSADGMTGWTRVVSGGLGNPANGRPYGMIAFGGRLYLVFSNTANGAEVWRSADGTTWEQVAEGGWGDWRNAMADYADKAAAVFNSRLYIGTFNTKTGGEIWKKTVTADFEASPRQGPPPLLVQFTNRSAGDYTSSQWNFGDGTTSTVANPSHTYAAGVYTVTLTVSDGVDTNTRSRVGYIRAAPQKRLYLPLVMKRAAP